MVSTTTATCLNTCTVQQPRTTLSRLHMVFHFAAVTAVLYYRLSNLVLRNVPLLSWGTITFAEIIFAFIWTLTQGFRWRPVERTAIPENLPSDENLPGVDVFICATKEVEVVDVMNTVLSAMALDYPMEKLAVYLSDDGGAAVMLYAMEEACVFAKCWIPFCRKYGVQTRCPEAFFSSFGDVERERLENDAEFKGEEEMIQSKYELFKRNVEKASEIEDSVNDVDRPPYIEVIYDEKNNKGLDDQSKMPLLVYVSREKRSSHPHHFKAGALNALLRVSGIMSNAPYALVLDSDIYCEDPTSAKQAMCFHLDPKLSHSLSYVQFPQIFLNVSRNDIHDGQAKAAYMTKYQGMDGLNGAVCSGAGYYLKKNSLYSCPSHEDVYLHDDVKKNFGFSPNFIDSVKELSDNKHAYHRKNASDATVEEAKKLASCTYEENTSWGKERIKNVFIDDGQIGYSYECMLESTFTGYLLHCKGWKSVFLYPQRPSFLGCSTIDMKDALAQLMKWSSTLVQVGFSRFSPLTHGMSRMSVLQSMCYGYFSFSHFFSIACLLYGIVPQLCFFYGTPIYPKITCPWFAIFALVFFSSRATHVYEVVYGGGSIRAIWYEQRIWLIKSVTACLFGCLDAFVNYINRTSNSNSSLTNNDKAIDGKEKLEKRKFDLSKLFGIPLTMLVLLNLGCFIGGIIGLVSERNIVEMFGQGFLSLYVLLLSLPILRHFF